MVNANFSFERFESVSTKQVRPCLKMELVLPKGTVFIVSTFPLKRQTKKITIRDSNKISTMHSLAHMEDF